MAIYHLHAGKIIGRTKGQKAVRSAAYRSGEKLKDDRYGETHDFSRKRGVLYDEMFVPAYAPWSMRDRETFWNEVEKAEKRKNSQLAIPYDIALPHELNHAQHIALMREFIQHEFTDHGIVADLAIHMPNRKKNQKNFHAHILIPTRFVDEDGLGKKVIIADSKSDFEHQRGEIILRLRQSWAEHHNRHMDAAGFDESHHIDHRSYEEQGIDREPTTHRGVASDHMEERGITTDRGDEYREIEAENQKEALRKSQRKDYAGPAEAPKMPDAQSHDDKIADEALQKEKERQEQALADELKRQEEARRSDDALRDALIAADKKLKELGEIYRQAQEHRERLIQQTRELEEAHYRHERQESARRDEFQRQKNPVDHYIKENEDEIEGRRQGRIYEQEKRYLEGDIRNPHSRYAQALHNNYEQSGDPFVGLAKSAIAEHAAFRHEQDILHTQVANTADPKEREALEIRRKIEGYEYLTITGDRIAKQSEIITGRLNSEEAVKMRAAVHGETIKDEHDKEIAFPGYTQQAENLRFRYREIQAERAAPQKEQAKEPEPERAYRPRGRGKGRDLDDLIKKQDEAAKAKEAEREKNKTEFEKQQEKERERQRERERGRER